MRYIPTLFLTTTFLTATTTYGSGIAEFHPSSARPSAAAVAPVSAKTRAEEIEDLRQQATDSTVALWQRLYAIDQLTRLEATPESIISTAESIANNQNVDQMDRFTAIKALIKLKATITLNNIDVLNTIATNSKVVFNLRFDAIDKLIQLGVNDKAITTLETIIKKEELWYMPRAKELLEKASGASKPTLAAVEAAVAPNADDDDAPVAVVEPVVAVAQSPATLIKNLKVQLAQILKKYKGAAVPYWVGHPPRKNESEAKHTAYQNYLDDQAEVDRIRGELARLEPAEAPAAARRRR